VNIPVPGPNSTRIRDVVKSIDEIIFFAKKIELGEIAPTTLLSFQNSLKNLSFFRISI
jgi:hypothetical protein